MNVFIYTNRTSADFYFISFLTNLDTFKIPKLKFKPATFYDSLCVSWITEDEGVWACFYNATWCRESLQTKQAQG